MVPQVPLGNTKIVPHDRGGGGISLNGPVVAAVGAVWLLTDRGDVYAVGLPDLGAPSRNEHGESWVFPQRRGARLEPDLSGGYVVADSAGERYAYSLGANTLPGTLSQISFASGVLLNGPIVAALGNGWILTDRGSVYAFGLSDVGSPDRNQHGEDWSFPDRRAGQAPGVPCALEPRVDGGYNVFSTVGERYGYPGR